MKYLGKLCLIALLAALTNCASRQQQIDDLALQSHLQRDIITSDDGLSHLTYTNAAYQALRFSNNNETTKTPRIHVYFEGDGIPWIQPHLVAVDPTPKTALALQLMLLDQHASIYLGRPCYHGYYQQRGCHPLLWTQARYSKPVVDSMVNALLTKLEHDNRLMPSPPLTLIGYSGGGVLAMLVAERLHHNHNIASVDVVTIAANLDVDAWTRLHHFSSLTLSLNPAAMAQRFANIEQLHIYGERDKNVPPAIVLPVKARLGEKARWFSMASADHACCWEVLWPQILKSIP